MKNNKEIKRIKFQLGHLMGITMFKVLEQENIERGCGEIFKGSNGTVICSSVAPALTANKVFIRGVDKSDDNKLSYRADEDKKIYNNILQVFKELGNSNQDSELKTGDEVLCWDKYEECTNKYIFLTKVDSEYPYLVFNSNRDYEDFCEGDSFRVTPYKNVKKKDSKKFTQIDENTFEVTF